MEHKRIETNYILSFEKQVWWSLHLDSPPTTLETIKTMLEQHIMGSGRWKLQRSTQDPEI